MEHNKDIGDLLKDRLGDAKKAPMQTLWERLDNSLEEREKKRRRAAWFWYTGAGILLAILLIGGIVLTPDKNTIHKTATEISTEVNRNENETNAYKEIVTQNGTELNTENGTDVKGTPITETNSNNTTLENISTTKTATNKKGDTSNKNPMIEDGFKVTTTHEYYNSDLDTTTTSKNKQMIDSLVAANKRIMAIRDSIARKRATDSIKLNEASKDSIPE